MERFAIKIDKNVRINLCKICRLCGIDNPDKVPILEELIVSADSTINNDGEPELCKKIFDCVGIQVCKKDKMPQSICTLCHDKISDFFEFREMCSATNVQTRKLLGLPPDERLKIEVDHDVRTECILGLENDDKNFNILPTGKKRGRKKADSQPKESVGNIDIKDSKLTSEGNKKKIKLSTSSANDAIVQKKIKPDPSISLLRRNSQQLNLNNDSKTKLKKETKVLGQKSQKFSVKVPIIYGRRKKIKEEIPKRKMSSESVQDGKRKKIVLAKTPPPPVSSETVIKKDTGSNIDNSRKTILKSRKNLQSLALLSEKPPNKRERMRDIEEKKSLKMLSVEPPPIKKIKLLSDTPETPATKEICAICYRDFSTSIQHQEHLYIDHVPNVVEYHCEECNETIWKKSDVTNHNLWHKLSKTPFQCGRCTRPFYARAAYTKHVQECLTFYSPHIFQSITCEKCLKVFETQNLFDWHSCIINKRECPKCKKKFIKKVGVFKHIVHCNAERKVPEETKSNDQSDQSVQLAEPISNMNNAEINLLLKKEPETILEIPLETSAENIPFVVLAPAASTAMSRLDNSLPFDNNDNDYDLGDDSFHNDSDACSDQLEAEVNLNINIEKSSTAPKKVSTEKTKKLNRMRKKDMRRCEALLKDTYMTLVNIQKEPDGDSSSSISSKESEHSLPTTRIKEEQEDPGYAKYDSVVAANIKKEIPNEQQCTERLKPALKIKIKKEHGTLNSKFVSEDKVSGEQSSPTKKKKKKKKRIFRIPIGLAAKIKQEKLERESNPTDMSYDIPETTKTCDHIEKIVSKTIGSKQTDLPNQIELPDSEVNTIKMPIISVVAGGVFIPVTDAFLSTPDPREDYEIQKNNDKNSDCITEPDESYNLLKVKTEYVTEDYECPETYDEDVSHEEGHTSGVENSSNCCSTVGSTGHEFSIDIVKQEFASPKKYSSPAHSPDYNQNVSNISLPFTIEEHSLKKKPDEPNSSSALSECYLNKIIKVEPEEEISPPSCGTESDNINQNITIKAEVEDVYSEVGDIQAEVNSEDRDSSNDVDISSKIEKIGILSTNIPEDALESEIEKIELDKDSGSIMSQLIQSNSEHSIEVENLKSAEFTLNCDKKVEVDTRKKVNTSNDVNITFSAILDNSQVRSLESCCTEDLQQVIVVDTSKCRTEHTEIIKLLDENLADDKDNLGNMPIESNTESEVVSKQNIPSIDFQKNCPISIQENVECSVNLETVTDEHRSVKENTLSTVDLNLKTTELNIKSQFEQHNVNKITNPLPIPFDSLNRLDISDAKSELSDTKNTQDPTETFEIVASVSYVQNLGNEIDSENVHASLPVTDKVHLMQLTANITENTCPVKSININVNDNYTCDLLEQESVEKSITSHNLKKDDSNNSYKTELKLQSQSLQIDLKDILKPVESSKKENDFKICNIGESVQNIQDVAPNENDRLHEFITDNEHYAKSKLENVKSLKCVDQLEQYEPDESTENTKPGENLTIDENFKNVCSNLETESTVSSMEDLCNSESQQGNEMKNLRNENLDTLIEKDSNMTTCSKECLLQQLNCSNMQPTETLLENSTQDLDVVDSDNDRGFLQEIIKSAIESSSTKTEDLIQNSEIIENIEDVRKVTEILSTEYLTPVQLSNLPQTELNVQYVSDARDILNKPESGEESVEFKTHVADFNKSYEIKEELDNVTIGSSSSIRELEEINLLQHKDKSKDQIESAADKEVINFDEQTPNDQIESAADKEIITFVEQTANILSTEYLKPVQLSNLPQTELNIQYVSDARDILNKPESGEESVEFKTHVPDFNKSYEIKEELDNVTMDSSSSIRELEEINLLQHKDKGKDEIESAVDKEVINFNEQTPNDQIESAADKEIITFVEQTANTLEFEKLVEKQIISSTIIHTQDLEQIDSSVSNTTESQQQSYIQKTESSNESLPKEEDFEFMNSVGYITTDSSNEDHLFSSNAVIAHTDSVISYEMQVCHDKELNTNEPIIDNSIQKEPSNFPLEVENTNKIVSDANQLFKKDQSTTSLELEILKSSLNPTRIIIEKTVYTSGVIKENPMNSNTCGSKITEEEIETKVNSVENIDSYYSENIHKPHPSQTENIEKPESAKNKEEMESFIPKVTTLMGIPKEKTKYLLGNVPKLETVTLISLKDEKSEDSPNIESSSSYVVKDMKPIINVRNEIDLQEELKDSDEKESELRTVLPQLDLEATDNENSLKYHDHNIARSEKRESCISEIPPRYIDTISSKNTFKPSSTIIQNTLNNINTENESVSSNETRKISDAVLSSQRVIIGESSVIKYSSSKVQYTDNQKDFCREENILESHKDNSQCVIMNNESQGDFFTNTSINKDILNINISLPNEKIVLESDSKSLERPAYIDPIRKQRASIIQSNEFSDSIYDRNDANTSLDENKIKRDVVIFTTCNTDRLQKHMPIHKNLDVDYDIDDMDDPIQRSSSLTCNKGLTKNYDLNESKAKDEESISYSDTYDLEQPVCKTPSIQPTHNIQSANETETYLNISDNISNKCNVTPPLELDYRENVQYSLSKDQEIEKNVLPGKLQGCDLEPTSPSTNNEIPQSFHIDNDQTNRKYPNESPRTNTPVPSTSTLTTCINIENVNEIAENNNNANLEKQLQNEMELDDISSDSNENNFNEEQN